MTAGAIPSAPTSPGKTAPTRRTRVVDALRVLANDPDHAGLGLRLVQALQAVAQRADDRLVAVGVAPAGWHVVWMLMQCGW